MTPIEKFRDDLRHLQYAEAVTRILCRRSGLVDSWAWDAKGRRPPLPFWEARSVPGKCRVCGQPIYGGGSFRSFAGEQSKRLTWHRACTTTYFLWTKPSDYAGALIIRQNGLCADSAAPVGPPAKEYITDIDVDHRTPIYRVRRDHASEPWFELLRFWGLSNLCALTRDAHLKKCAAEAVERAHGRKHADQPVLML